VLQGQGVYILRKLSQVLGTLGLLLPTLSYAVGLGGVKLYSSLNQQLNAQVPIVDIGNVPLDSVQVKLASVDQFKLVGLERDPNLSLIRFNVLRANDGQAYVQISSTEPISDPIVTFLVNLSWPNGQMLREYTLFLDPVSYTSKSNPEFQPATATTTKTSNPTENATYGPTTSADDLWEIAKKTRLKNTSIQQNMVAIFKKNMSAFANNNINRLRTGYVLQLPTLSEVNALSTPNAISFLKQQDKHASQQKTVTPAAPQQAPTESQAQHEVQTLSEPLTSPTQLQSDNNKQSHDIELLPESELMKEGDQFIPSATDKALGVQSVENQRRDAQQKQLENKQIIEMQKKIIEKDRKILELEKVLEEQKEANQPDAMLSTTTNAAMGQQTTSAPQAGEIKLSYGLPWYTFPLLVLIVFASLIAGVFIQRYRIKSGYVDEKIMKNIDISEMIKKVLNRKQIQEPKKDYFEQIAEETTSEPPEPEADESVANKFDLMSSIPEIEKLIGQKAYQQAIDKLIILREQTGHAFDINIKLLEIYGLSRQQQNFQQCYQQLKNSGVSSTQEHLLDSIVSMFPELCEDTAQAPQEAVEFNMNEQPEEFSINPEVETEVEQPAIEPETTISEEKELDQTTAEESSEAHTIDFDDTDLGKYAKPKIKPVEENKPSENSENIDEEVWNKMLGNLSVESEQDNSPIDVDSDNIPTEDTESEPEAEPELEEAEDFETQLNLATAYIEMGDIKEAKQILVRVIADGSEEERQAAKQLLKQIK